MNTLQITNGTHPQSGKTVEFINILNRSFIYADRRGRSQYAGIDKAFAEQIIAAFPHDTGRTGLPVYYPERMYENMDYRLSWCLWTDKSRSLTIHCGSYHVWTSKKIS